MDSIAQLKNLMDDLSKASTSLTEYGNQEGSVAVDVARIVIGRLKERIGALSQLGEGMRTTVRNELEDVAFGRTAR